MFCDTQGGGGTAYSSSWICSNTKLSLLATYPNSHITGVYNMTDEIPVEIEIYGSAGRPHKKVYPTYENAEGYQIRPDRSRHVDTGAWLYFWKVKTREF